MSRRDIRRMLLTPKNRVKDRPWAVPALMAAVLAAGVGIGVGIGLWAVDDPGADQTVKAAAVVDRPPRHEEMLKPPGANDVVHPIVPMPAARPGGPADDGFDPQGEDDTPVPAAVVAPPVAAPAPQPALTQPVAFATPPWERFAVPPPRTGGLPMIAVVIDDMGVDKKRSARVVHLRAPLTLAWLTYAEDLPEQTAAARKRGHELMLHVPMEPKGEKYDPGPDVLEVKLSPDEIRRRLEWGLDRFQGFVGINNHMGSRFTGDASGMAVVMQELHRRGLMFLDSVTTSASAGPAMARKYAVPFAERQVFLDNEASVPAVRAQLAKLEALARKHGAAIAIGHPHDATIDALSGWLATVESRGFVLVPVTTVVKANRAQG